MNHEKQDEIFKEENKEKRKKIIVLVLKIILIIGILGTGFFFYTTYISTTSVIVNEKRIIDSKIPDSFNGVKIIHFSDLHYGSTFFNKELEKVVKLINERKPDIVVFTGDLIDEDYKLTNKEQEKIIKILQNINTTLGKYAIMGEEDGENFTTILNQSNFTILNNDYDLIYKDDNNPILITGTSSLLKEDYDIDKAFAYFKQETYNSDIYTISLIHEGDLAEEIVNKYSSNLILAGHSHNGEIRVPYLGSLVRTSGSTKYSNPYYEIGNTKLFVSSGLGTKILGIRLFCRPSINFYRLANK